MKTKSENELKLQVENFNLKYRKGDKVNVDYAGKVKEVTVKDEATILGGHSAVGWFNEITGCYSLDKIIA